MNNQFKMALFLGLALFCTALLSALFVLEDTPLVLNFLAGFGLGASVAAFTQSLEGSK